uniref:AMP-dependent synthetase/ligase domain-containing protein n=1 Tax=Panagrolaimus sp. JU765 TaxID=591449 RepID=A0AC34QWW6_9BILA
MSSTIPLLHNTIGERLRMSVDQCPDRTMVIFKHCNIRKTYAELFADARQLAASLIHLGVKKGDRVGIWGPNYYEWVVTQFATAMAGMVLVSLNPAYQSEELRFALHKVGVKAIITPPTYKTSNYKRTLREIVPEMTSEARGIGKIHSKDLPELEHAIIFKGEPGKKYKGFWSYEELLKAPTSEDFSKLEKMEKKVRFDDPAGILYTSGTTGYPKAATLTHHNIVNNSYFIGMRMNFDSKHEILCLPTPLYHGFGSVMGVVNAINHKQTSVFPSPSFNAEAALKAVAEEKCTVLYGTPTMFIDILNRPELPKTDISSLHGGIIAGAPCPTALCERLIKDLKMDDFVVCYGSSEVVIVAMSYPTDTPEERCRSVGHVKDHIELAVFNKEGELVNRGEKGEVCTRGYNVMLGYFNDEEKTREAITPDKWYHTG